MKKLIYLSCLALIVLTFSCKKEAITVVEKDNPAIETEQFENIQAFLDTYKPQVERFTFDAAIGLTTTTAKYGSQIQVPANVLVNASGQLVTGNVELKILEVFSKADMIYTGAYPWFNNQPLNSGAEFYIGASQKGEVLEIKDSMEITYTVPAQDTGQMTWFAAFGDENDSDELEWLFAANTGVKIGVPFDYMQTNNSYKISLSYLSWCNIDEILSLPTNYNEFEFKGVEADLNHTNTETTIVLKNNNTAFPLTKSNGANFTNNVLDYSNLPAVEMTVFTISVIDKELYYGAIDIDPEAGLRYTIDLSKTSAEDLNTFFQSL